MNIKPEIAHDLNKHGYVNVSYENKLGVYKLSDRAESYVKVCCDYDDLDEVQTQVNRHIDCVKYTSKIVDGNESIYVTDVDQSNYYDSHAAAVLAKLDIEGGLESLYHDYKYTLSPVPDDIVKDSTTRRTSFTSKSINDVINNLTYYPYIHRLRGFTEQQYKDLYELSLRIQKQLGKPYEVGNREVDWK